MFNGFVTAWRTLTAIPMLGRDAEQYRHSLPFFPWVGAVIGATIWGGGYLFSNILHCHGGVTAFLMLLLSTLITGGIHLDGLADGADGLLPLAATERRLEIMKDSRVGSFGVIALVLNLLGKWVGYWMLASGNMLWLVVPAFVFARTAQVELITSMPYARNTEGTAKRFVEGAGMTQRLVAWFGAAVLIAPLGLLVNIASGILYVFIQLLRRFYHCKVGGITGDLVGLCNELCETIFLLGTAVALPMIFEPTQCACSQMLSLWITPVWSLL